MRRHLGGHVDAALLGPADDVDGPGGGEVTHVQSRADMLGEEHIARDDRFLRDRGPACEPELGRDGALVHLRALGESRILRMLSDDAAERLHIFERAAHDERIRDARAVVTEDAHAGA